MKNNSKIIINFITLTFCLLINAQEIKVTNDEQELKMLVKSISYAVNSKDSIMIIDAFAHPKALIYDLYNGQYNGVYSDSQNIALGLADFVKNSKREVKQFTISIKVKIISKGRATVTDHYKVTIDGKASHQGEEFYTAIKTKNGWKFISLMFTLELPSNE